MLFSAIQSELRREVMGSTQPNGQGAALTGLALAFGPPASYIATLGLWQCLARTWPREVAAWDWSSSNAPAFGSLDLDAIRTHLLGRATRNDWTAPLRETKHPLLGNAGRRSLLRGVGEAREWMAAGLTADEREGELDWVLTGKTPTRLRSSPRYRTTPSGYWNLGTICPNVLASNGSPYGNYASPWLAVLAWEALPWLDHDWTARANARPRLFKTEGEGARRHDFPFIEQISGDECQWVVPTWHEPIELRRMGVWFRGRRGHTGRTWSRSTWARYHDHPSVTWQTYGLRRLVSEQTWEFLSYGKATHYSGHGEANERTHGAGWVTRYTSRQIR